MSTLPSFSVNLWDEGDEGSKFRLRNGPGEKQREHILDRGSDFTVQGDLVNVTHGSYAPGGHLATLVIAEFRFLGGDSSRCFRAATINFTFSQPASNNRECPEVVAIAPFGHFSLNMTRTTEEVKRMANVGAGFSAPVGGGVNAAVGWEFTQAVEKDDRATLMGIIRVEGKFSGPSVKNTARFVLTENRSQSDGLPSYLRTAILLKRKNNSEFIARINVKAEVDVAYSIKNWLRPFFGEKVDPIIFDPTIDPMGENIVDLDPENLSAVKVEKLCAIKSTTVITTTVEMIEMLGD